VYATDAALLETAVLPVGAVWADGRFEGASLDHAMWFHRPPRADRWLLFDQRAEALGGGRGLASGRLVDEQGRVVGSVFQEGSLRPVDGDTWMAQR
jgi:acyl-CoA thioesterase-2